MTGDMNERCPTGIVGFDSMTHGGFVRNSSNVVVGGPGSGKSTFLMQFLYNGAVYYNEPGLYCSFEPDILDTLNDAFVHGWDFFRLAEEGRIKFIKFSPETSIDELKNELTRLISQNGIKRICFDPVSVLALNVMDSGKIRERVFDLVSLMKRLRVTSILADESMESESSVTDSRDGDWTKTDIIRFLCDSVSILYSTGLTTEGDRTIKIEKMRRTKHERDFIGMEIKDDGMDVKKEPFEGQVLPQQALAQLQQQMQLEQGGVAPQGQVGQVQGQNPQGQVQNSQVQGQNPQGQVQNPQGQAQNPQGQVQPQQMQQGQTQNQQGQAYSQGQVQNQQGQVQNQQGVAPQGQVAPIAGQGQAYSQGQ